MLRGRRILTVVAALAALGTTSLQAQSPETRGAAGSDLFTVNLYGGGYTPTSELAADSDFGNSGTVGAAVTLWAHRYVGIRANGLYARTEASAGAPAELTGENPRVWAYSGDVLLRLPLSVGNGRDTWFPYLVGGLGAKTYAFDGLDSETDFAGNFGGGVEYRIARWGIQAEVRDIVSNFDRFGVDQTQHDVVWTAGLTMSF